MLSAVNVTLSESDNVKDSSANIKGLFTHSTRMQELFQTDPYVTFWCLYML